MRFHFQPDLNVNITFFRNTFHRTSSHYQCIRKVEDIQCAATSRQTSEYKIPNRFGSPKWQGIHAFGQICALQTAQSIQDLMVTYIILNCPLHRKNRETDGSLQYSKGKKYPGTWTLNVKDNKVGDGGSFSGFSRILLKNKQSIHQLKP